jgi:hypothetical protein
MARCHDISKISPTNSKEDELKADIGALFVLYFSLILILYAEPRCTGNEKEEATA